MGRHCFYLDELLPELWQLIRKRGRFFDSVKVGPVESGPTASDFVISVTSISTGERVYFPISEGDIVSDKEFGVFERKKVLDVVYNRFLDTALAVTQA